MTTLMDLNTKSTPNCREDTLVDTQGEINQKISKRKRQMRIHALDMR